MSDSCETAAGASRQQAGPLRDVLDLFVRPAVLFGRLPLHPRSGVALLLLLAAHIASGFLLIETGVPDYEIDVGVQRELSRKLRHYTGTDDVDELATVVEAIEKQGVFQKLALRLYGTVGRPLVVLCKIGILAAALFAIAALTAGRPNYRVLAAVVIYANLVDIPRLAVEAGLVRSAAASRVEISLAAFSNPEKVDLFTYLLLRQTDPFAVWFWGLVALGAWRTGQTSLRTAVVATVLLALLAAGMGAVADLPALVDFSTLMPEPT